MIVDHCVEEHSTATSIDHRRSHDAQRIDIAAGQRRPVNRVAEHGVPDNMPGISIQPIDEIVFGCGNNKGRSNAWWSPIQWLRIYVSLDITVEGLKTVHRTHGLPIEAGDDVVACAVRRTTVERDSSVSGCRGETWYSDQHQSQDHANHCIAPLTAD
jgi:hypothetical protein